MESNLISFFLLCATYEIDCTNFAKKIVASYSVPNVIIPWIAKFYSQFSRRGPLRELILETINFLTENVI